MVAEGSGGQASGTVARRRRATLLVTNIITALCFSCMCTGTGKSITGAHIAYAFVLLNRMNATVPDSATADEVVDPAMADSGADWPHLKCVLYCGPSNVSVDVVLSKLQMPSKCASSKFNSTFFSIVMHRSPPSSHQKFYKTSPHSPHVWKVN